MVFSNSSLEIPSILFKTSPSLFSASAISTNNSTDILSATLIRSFNSFCNSDSVTVGNCNFKSFIRSCIAFADFFNGVTVAFKISVVSFCKSVEP
ncbi:hypothetical protein LDVICp239 [lymphocystis disease virus-China]|uniref:Uncharacterized protein n=1 Tax=lymphocystis disease virus-China TaxID=256729 RepID=Q677M5_9VIRU|nr:hypothetical protein LDVICp239 [lymphocystis disease virus-China]AAU11082.1 hypothetical protein [lymphocystis disease virus-China]